MGPYGAFHRASEGNLTLAQGSQLQFPYRTGVTLGGTGKVLLGRSQCVSLFAPSGGQMGYPLVCPWLSPLVFLLLLRQTLTWRHQVGQTGCQGSQGSTCLCLPSYVIGFANSDYLSCYLCGSFCISSPLKSILGAEDLAQVIGCLPSIHGALGLMVRMHNLSSQEVRWEDLEFKALPNKLSLRPTGHLEILSQKQQQKNSP